MISIADAPRLELGGTPPPATVVRTAQQLTEIMSVLQATTGHQCNDLRIRMDPSVDKAVDRTILGQFFTEALRMYAACQSVPRTVVESKPSLEGIRVIAIHKDSMTPLRFACLFSALPYTRSVHTLRLEEANRSYPWKLKKLELSWLAYAIFHPATKASSWRKLVVGNCKFVGDVMGVLQQMGDAASRRKLLSVTSLAMLLGVDRSDKKRKRGAAESTSQGADRELTHQLRRASVAKDSVIRVNPRDDAGQLVVVQDEPELQLCDFHFESWCCVLVPGFGFGWVHERDIRKQNDWQPESDVPVGESPLTNLELGYPITMGKMLLFLAATGKSLEMLALESFGLQSSVLDDVSRFCPHLKALTIKSSRVSLSRNSLQRYFSQPTTRTLRSLTLSWNACNHIALLEILSKSDEYASVSSLKELRLDKAHYIERFAVMLDVNRTLERLIIDHWSSSYPSFLLRHDGEVLPTATASHAFLSVVAQRSKMNAESALGKLNKDVFALIFQFAAVHRVICISSLVM